MNFVGWQPHDEAYWKERYMTDMHPTIMKWSSMIGERAMQGDMEAESIIRRHRVFECWWDEQNYMLLGKLVKNWIKKHEN